MQSLYALHGFLGAPADWDALARTCSMLKLYATELRCAEQNSFDQWAQDFNHHAAQDPSLKILLGYSLGGRLAMHALLNAPHLWKAAIIVSANPGLKCTQMKAKRAASDAVWAKRFENEPWEQLMTQWNSQGVLSTSLPLIRNEKDYSRLELSRQLKNWSLGMQDNLAEKLAQLQIPILWMAGENDPSYASIAKDLHFAHKSSKIWIAPNSGHRIPWDKPDAFYKQTVQFIDSLEGEL